MRGVLRARVCKGGTVTLCHDEGSRTLTELYHDMPLQCRYAVVKTTRGFEVWDFNDRAVVGVLVVKLKTTPPVHATLDAAVMAVALNYRETG